MSIREVQFMRASKAGDGWLFGARWRVAVCVAHYESTDGRHLRNGRMLGPWQTARSVALRPLVIRRHGGMYQPRRREDRAVEPVTQADALPGSSFEDIFGDAA